MKNIFFTSFLMFHGIYVTTSDFSTVIDSYLWPDQKNTFGISENYINKTIVQVSIVLPEKSRYNVDLVPAQKRSGPGILAGFEEAKRRNLTQDLVFNLTFRDSKCDNTYGPKSFTDAIVDGVEVLFGPSCEYALGKHPIV